MPDLSRELRRGLETTVKAARVAAEAGAADALRRLGVATAELPPHLEPRRAERNRLRAHARSLGDRVLRDGTHEIGRVTEAAAYVQWHRLVFARFLLERGLLRDETGVVILITDCREEAAMAGAGEEWSIAAAHAARLLPGVFPPDDPLESLTLAPEHAKALRDRLRDLDAAIFQADDSLGWTYQFWRAAEKMAVNDSQVKIGAAELPAVTQLFTEPYMVRFLLHNTLGAWWAGKVLAARPGLARDATDEATLRTACAVNGYQWDYLRFVRGEEAWRPVAGVFAGWPARPADITVLDPCCGSGHFLTAALEALAALRSAEERLTPADAIVAVLRDNLAGLEIDGRCVQIAAFALALTAWRIGGAETTLPTPHVAWAGAPPPLPKTEFAALANGDGELRRGLEALYDVFVQAPLLGSLIEITGGDLASPTRVARIEEMIAELVEKMRVAEPERAEGALAARGMADAASILVRRFVLQVTNVPFLGRGRQDAALATHLAARFAIAKSDLATAMLTRMRSLALQGGTVAAVTPQNWLFLGGYKKLREAVLAQASLALVAVIGEHGFDSSAAAGAFTAMVALSEARPNATTVFAGLDANDARDPPSKAAMLSAGEVRVLRQSSQLANPDGRIATNEASGRQLLADYAISLKGIATGDLPRFILRFWEVASRARRWEFLQEPPTKRASFTSRSGLVLWEQGSGTLRSFVAERLGEGGVGAWLRGGAAWGHSGVAIAQMRSLPVTLYSGDLFDESTGAIVPKSPDDLSAIWEFVQSEEYAAEVRKIDRSLKVPTLTLLKVPFDVARWRDIAAEMY